MHTPHPFEVMVARLPQAVITLPFANYGQGYAFALNYQFRYDKDRLQVGLASRFDRWANSVDFECRPVPENQGTFDALIAVLDRARAEQWTPEHEFGTIDLWPFVRKQRRETASAERLAYRRQCKTKR